MTKHPRTSKPGTPPPRSARITVLVSPEEVETLNRISHELGVSRADVLRRPLHPLKREA